MSDKNKNKKSPLTDFIRYRKDEMTGKERNALERELQKDPFAEEAVEGFAGITPEDADGDISNLQKRLEFRIGRRQRLIFYRIAASVTVLMVISSIFIIVERNRTPEQLAEVNTELPVVEIPESKPLTKIVITSLEPENNVMLTENKENKLVADQIRKEDTQLQTGAGKEKYLAAIVHDSIAIQEVMKAEKNAAVDQMAAPKAALAERNINDIAAGAVNGIVTDERKGYPGYTPPQPVVGKENYDKYIRENLHRPEILKVNQEAVVVVSFIVQSNGIIDSIKIIRSPGQPFSDEAMRLIKEGPAWIPASKNGNTINDEIRFRIVFK